MGGPPLICNHACVMASTATARLTELAQYSYREAWVKVFRAFQGFKSRSAWTKFSSVSYIFTRNLRIPAMDPPTAEPQSLPPPFSPEQLEWLHTQFGRPVDVDPPASQPPPPPPDPTLSSTAATNPSGELLQ